MPRALRARGNFLHECLRVRPKASFDELFLAAGEALRVLLFRVCLGKKKKTHKTLVKTT